MAKNQKSHQHHSKTKKSPQWGSFEEFLEHQRNADNGSHEAQKYVAKAKHATECCYNEMNPVEESEENKSWVNIVDFMRLIDEKVIFPDEFNKIKMEADNGKLISQIKVGLCYANGIAVEQSWDNAFKYYHLAANHPSYAIGSAQDQAQRFAFGLLGNCYQEGRGCEKSDKGANKYYKLSADKGYSHAQIKVSDFYSQLMNQEAFKHYLLAANQGDARAQYLVGDLYLTMGLPQLKCSSEEAKELSFKFHHLSSKQGYAPAQIRMGNYYLFSILENHQEIAFNYFFSAACQGEAEAQYELGNLYKNGKGTKKDLTKAFEYFKLASDQNHLEAIWEIAICFKEGLGIEESEEEALKYFRLAVDNDHFYYNRLSSSLGGRKYCEKLSEITHIEPQKKFILEKEMADAGDVPSQLEVAMCYRQGLGVKKSYKSAFYYYNLAAQKNSAKAFYYLGDFYDRGLGFESCLEKAKYYYELGANLGDSLAMERLGHYYASGLGVEKSPARAFFYYKKAADIDMDTGGYKGLYALAKCYREGFGVKRSFEKAIYFFQRLIANGHLGKIPVIKACYRMMEERACQTKIIKRRVSKSDFKYLKSQADSGNILFEVKTATSYEKGLGVKQSWQKAFKYYLLAANHDSYPPGSIEDTTQRFAYAKLGDYYYEGLACEKSDEEAIRYFKLGAEASNGYLGDIYGQLSLAIHYGKGLGVKQSYELAFYYCKLAADRGYAEAQFRLGIFYELGKGIVKSIKDAMIYYQLAAKKGHQLAQQRISYITKEPDKEFLSYKNAADHGSAEAQYILGNYYLRGVKVKQNLNDAFKYFKLAADQGNNASLCALAHCYEKGKGVVRSFEEAFKYYKLAADNQYGPGLYAVANFYLRHYAPECRSKKYYTAPMLSKAIQYYELALAQGYNVGDVKSKIEICENHLRRNIMLSYPYKY